jgi:hypothetical protein
MYAQDCVDLSGCSGAGKLLLFAGIGLAGNVNCMDMLVMYVPTAHEGTGSSGLTKDNVDIKD